MHSLIWPSELESFAEVKNKETAAGSSEHSQRKEQKNIVFFPQCTVTSSSLYFEKKNRCGFLRVIAHVGKYFVTSSTHDSTRFSVVVSFYSLYLFIKEPIWHHLLRHLYQLFACICSLQSTEYEKLHEYIPLLAETITHLGSITAQCNGGITFFHLGLKSRNGSLT